MSESKGKGVPSIKAFKVIMIIFTIAMVALLASTIYGWVTGSDSSNIVILAGCGTVYLASWGNYANMKKNNPS
jgi:MFS-type transporter involved in bile tolerance (Atg22 family)